MKMPKSGPCGDSGGDVQRANKTGDKANAANCNALEQYALEITYFAAARSVNHYRASNYPEINATSVGKKQMNGMRPSEN